MRVDRFLSFGEEVSLRMKTKKESNNSRKAGRSMPEGSKKKAKYSA